MTVAIAGCGTDHATHAAAGTVTYKGRSVQGAEVSFLPKSASAEAKPARGTTDSSGRFSLKTYFGPDDDASGAMAGDYFVTVQKIEQVEGIVDPYKQALPKNELPAKYATPQKSPLSASVTREGPNQFDLKLED